MESQFQAIEKVKCYILGARYNDKEKRDTCDVRRRRGGDTKNRFGLNKLLGCGSVWEWGQRRSRPQQKKKGSLVYHYREKP